MKHKGTEFIETERIILRKFEKDDYNDMFGNWCNDSYVTKYLQWLPHGNINVTKGILSTWIKAYQKRDHYNWAIKYKVDNKVIGSIGVVNFSEEYKHCEIGYCLGKDYWNKGIMTECLISVTKYLIDEIGFNRVAALHHGENINSGKVMIRAGIKFE